MQKVTQYLFKNIFVMSLVVLSIVFGIYFIFTFLAQLGSVGQGDFGIWSAIFYVFLTVPASLNLVFPVIAMMGVLMSISLLAQNSELVAMRASGVSWWGISKAVLLAGFVFAVLSFLIGSYIAPKFNQFAATYKQTAQRGDNLYLGEQALWLKDGNNFLMIKQSSPGYHGVLNHVSRFHIHNGRLESILKSKQAVYKNNQWVLHNADQIILEPKYKHTFHSELVEEHFITPQLLKLIADSSSVDSLTLSQLNLVMKYRKDNKMSIDQYEIAFWRIIFQPISVIVLMFSVLPYLFNATKRRSFALRLFIGGVIGFAFFIFNQFFSQIFVVYDIHLSAASIAALPPVLFFLATLLAMRLQPDV